MIDIEALKFDETYTLEGAIIPAEFEKALLGQPVGVPVSERKYEDA